MVRRVLLCLLCCLFHPAFAQDAPLYDPSYLPADLTRTRLKACGIEIAVDKSWVAETQKVKLENGKTQTQYSFIVAQEYWDRDTRPAEKVVVNPFLYLRVKCEKTSFKSTDSIDGLAFISEHIYDTMKKQKEYKLAPLRQSKAPGIGRVFQIVGYTKSANGRLKGRVQDVSRFYAVHKGMNISITLEIDRSPPRKARKKRDAGEIIELAYASGEIVRFKLATPSREDSAFGTVYFQRSAKQNAEIIERIRQSLRGF